MKLIIARVTSKNLRYHFKPKRSVKNHVRFSITLLTARRRRFVSVNPVFTHEIQNLGGVFKIHDTHNVRTTVAYSSGGDERRQFSGRHHHHHHTISLPRIPNADNDA